MIAELENDAELKAILAKPFESSAQYDEEGDCVEFFAENVPFNAVRLDDWVTMYVSERDDRLVGCLIKRVQRLFREVANLQEIVLVQDNRMRLDYFFVAAAARLDNKETIHRYNELKRATEGVEVPLPCAV